MLAIELRFLANRFHATPWDRQVNEGAVEWPPSPWRVARALVATWHHKARHDVEEADLREALRLFEAPPSYRLPPAIIAHTRHYMPIREKTTKVFDTFVRPVDWEAEGPDAALVMAWEAPPALSASGLAALRLLLERLGYLGRAESWIEATLVADWDGTPNVRPLAVGAATGAAEEEIRLLAPEAAEVYADWRLTTVEAHGDRRQAELRARDAAKGKPGSVAKPSAKDRAAIEAALPPDLFAALHAEVGDLRKDGWSQPPGSRWLAYSRGVQALAGGGRASRVGRTVIGRAPTVARFALVNKPLPPLEEAVRLGDLMRSTVMRKSQDVRGPREQGFAPAPVFTGRDDDGVSQVGHLHAYYMAESSGRGADRGRITNMTVFARQGFEPADQQALMRCSSLYDHTIEGQIGLVFLGFEAASAADYGTAPCASLATATTWASVTPFVPPRHSRAGQDDPDEGVLAQVVRELRNHGLPADALVQVELLDTPAERARWLRFRRQRVKGGGAQGSRQGYGVRLTFAHAVSGPIALGYGAHFGLGRFEPVTEGPRHG